MFEYRATLIRVVDGDTVWLDVDLGFDVRRKDSFRLYGIDTPELGTPEGEEAKRFVEDMVEDQPLLLRTIKDRREKYGRYLGIIVVGGVSVNDALVRAGHAREYYPKGVPTPAELPAMRPPPGDGGLVVEWEI